jgi:hypothetical protein
MTNEEEAFRLASFCQSKTSSFLSTCLADDIFFYIVGQKAEDSNEA